MVTLVARWPYCRAAAIRPRGQRTMKYAKMRLYLDAVSFPAGSAGMGVLPPSWTKVRLTQAVKAAMSSAM
jgi:hypothetical protein